MQSNPQIEIAQGKLRGTQHSRHQSFLGIPFAKPPVGALRFAAPQPAEAWSGVRQASAFAASCPQPDNPMPGIAASGPRDEDCLYLNVYTPKADSAKRPVLFWIHGGGFVWGSGSEAIYDGGPLAERGDVVVVTINYRLGVLGYLYLADHGGDRFGAATNVGQLDQIAALNWVRDNIQSFGGDPSNVTIFGESAGAFAVSTLMAMPAAKGGFCRVIAQSGTANRLANREFGAANTDALLRQLGLKSTEAEKLRDVPATDLIQAQVSMGGMRRPTTAITGSLFWPVYGVDTLPEKPLAVVRAGGAKHVDLIVGTNRDESKLFSDPSRSSIDDAQLAKRVASILPRGASDRVDAVIDVYRKSRADRRLPARNGDILDAISTDSLFRVPCGRLALAQRAHQPNTYVYLLCWESPTFGGACHGLDISLVFGTMGAPRMSIFAGEGPEVEALSANMMDAWIAFAKTGNPSHAKIGAWSPYDTTSRNTMVFDRNSRLVGAPFDEERAVWDEMLG